MATPLSIQPHYGSAVRGPQRFPRLDLEAEFDNAILGGNGATLFGLRRTGKSSEATACAERLQAQGLTVVEIDSQGVVSEAELLLKIFASLPAKGLKDRIFKAIAGDNSIAASAREAITQLNRDRLDDIKAYFAAIDPAIERSIRAMRTSPDATEQSRIVLFVDEFPWLCRHVLEGDEEKGRQRIDQLFAALRRWRSAGMGMLLMGSIGLIGLGREHKLELDHLNDLTALSMPPFHDAEQATAFINALVAGSEVRAWSSEHTQNVLDESAAWYPAMLQKAFQALSLGGQAVELERIPDIFAEKIRPELDKTFFEQFDRRLKRYRSFTESWAIHLPKLCEAVLVANGPVARDYLHSGLTGTVDESDLGDALAILREDGFLDVRVNRDGSQYWRPASPLVTAWRIQRRGGR